MAARGGALAGVRGSCGAEGKSASVKKWFFPAVAYFPSEKYAGEKRRQTPPSTSSRPTSSHVCVARAEMKAVGRRSAAIVVGGLAGMLVGLAVEGSMVRRQREQRQHYIEAEVQRRLRET